MWYKGFIFRPIAGHGKVIPLVLNLSLELFNLIMYYTVLFISVYTIPIAAALL